MLIDFVSTVSGVSLAEAPGFLKVPGGAPANVAIAVARLGGKAAFVGKLGDDEFGHMLAGILKENGVSADGVNFEKRARTALAFVTLRSDAEREFMFYRNPSANMLLTPDELNLDLIRSMDELTKNTFAVHVVAACASVALGTAIIYPLDSLTVLKQVGSTTGKQLAVGQILARVRAISGYSGLYSGLGWLIVGRTFGLGARFGVYEILTAFYKDGREDSYVDVSEALMAGFAAGMVESLVSSPFEIIKLRAQVASASRSLRSSLIAEKSSVSPLISSLLPRYSMNMMSLSNSIGILSTLTTIHKNLATSLREYPWMMTGSGRPPAVSNVRKPSDIIALEGWRGLWRGLRSGVVRDSIFGGIFFSSWQFLHNAMINWKAVGMDPIPRGDEDVGPLSPLAVSLAAGVSGSIAGAASHCFDTAKSRSQCTVIPKYISMERKLLKWRKPGKRLERLTGIHPADRSLLLNGIRLRTVHCGLASFVVVGSYFIAIDLLASD